MLRLESHCITARTLPAGQASFLVLAHLASMSLLGTAVDDRGCRNLAAALPRLKELSLGSKAVGDKGLRALCTLPQASRLGRCVLLLGPRTRCVPLQPDAPRSPTCSMHAKPCSQPQHPSRTTSASNLGTTQLPQLEALHLVDSSITDPGLLRALPRCPTLRRLSLQGCWLASEAGLQAAAGAAQQAGGQLSEVLRDRTLVAVPPPAGGRAASTGLAAAGPIRPGSGTTATESPAARRRSIAAGRLTAHVLEHDERLAYSREELLQLGTATQSGCAAAAAAQLRASLPSDLRSP